MVDIWRHGAVNVLEWRGAATTHLPPAEPLPPRTLIAFARPQRQQKKDDDDNNHNNDVDKLLQDNIALVRLLLILSRAGEKGIPTVELLKKLKSSHYGQQMIKLAQSKGYVERVNVKQPEEGRKGGSKNFVINRLSQKGKKLVQKLTTTETGEKP